MAAKKKKKKTNKLSSTVKKSGKNKAKPSLPGYEQRFWPRIFASTTGRAVMGVVFSGVLIVFNTLVSGQNGDRFLLMTGIEILIAMIAFWVILLYRRAARAD